MTIKVQGDILKATLAVHSRILLLSLDLLTAQTIDRLTDLARVNTFMFPETVSFGFLIVLNAISICRGVLQHIQDRGWGAGENLSLGRRLTLGSLISRGGQGIEGQGFDQFLKFNTYKFKENGANRTPIRMVS